MARRRTAWTPEKVRQRIRTGVLVRRLVNHALGNLEMSATQVKAAEIVLRKVIPDMKSIEHSGEIRHRDVSDQPLTAEQWQERYSGDHLASSSGTSESVN